MGGSTERTILEDIAGIVGKAAPVLGAVLGTPLAHLGIGLLANAFGADSEDAEALLRKISGDPHAMEKIAALQYRYQAMLEKIAAQNYQTEVDDRKSARDREVKMRDYVPTFLALGFLINYAVIQFYCVMHPASEIDIISARFQDVLIMIMSYYFGSAHKSAT